jgi:hypothetical protein
MMRLERESDAGMVGDFEGHTPVLMDGAVTDRRKSGRQC